MSKVKTYNGHAVPDGATCFVESCEAYKPHFGKEVDGIEYVFSIYNDHPEWNGISDILPLKARGAIELPEEEDNQETPPRSSQPHYKDDKDGLDHIARFARDNSIEEFRAAMRFTIDKYRDRLGEKDDRSKELGKIADYYRRWAEVELELESKTDGC